MYHGMNILRTSKKIVIFRLPYYAFGLVLCMQSRPLDQEAPSAFWEQKPLSSLGLSSGAIDRACVGSGHSYQS